MARHIAAKAAAPDSKRPPSLAWNRASSAVRSTGHASGVGEAKSMKSIDLRRSRLRINAISRRHSGQSPSNQTIRLLMMPIWRAPGSFHAAVQTSASHSSNPSGIMVRDGRLYPFDAPDLSFWRYSGVAAMTAKAHWARTPQDARTSARPLSRRDVRPQTRSGRTQLCSLRGAGRPPPGDVPTPGAPDEGLGAASGRNVGGFAEGLPHGARSR